MKNLGLVRVPATSYERTYTSRHTVRVYPVLIKMNLMWNIDYVIV